MFKSEYLKENNTAVLVKIIDSYCIVKNKGIQ